MVRKKRKIAAAQHGDDVLSVKRKRQLSSRLLSPAFPMSAVPGWARARARGVLGGAEESVHRQLQALQAHRRALLDSAAATGAGKSVGKGKASEEAQPLGLPAHCGDLTTFLIHLIAAPASSQFHKISALMLDDAFRCAPDATRTAAATAMHALQVQWHLESALDQSTASASSSSTTTTTTTTTSFTDITTLSDAVSSLLSTSLISQHVLAATRVSDNDDETAAAAAVSSPQQLLVIQLFQTLVSRLNSELVNAGCSESSVSLVESMFAHKEEDVKKMCCVFLKFLQTPTVRAALQLVRKELHAKQSEEEGGGGGEEGEGRGGLLSVQLEHSVHALARFLDQVLRSHICAKDTLTMASMCMVLLARSFSSSKHISADSFRPTVLGHSREIACGLLRGTLSWTNKPTPPSTTKPPAVYSDLSKLAICRGLLKGFPIDTLTHAVHIVGGGQDSGNTESLLYPTIFEHVYHCCMSSTTDATRTYAFQSLQQWMSTAEKVNWKLQAMTEGPISEETDGATPAAESADATVSLSPTSTTMAASILNRIQDVVLANWDHKSRTVSHMMPVVFKSLLAAQDQIADNESRLLESRMALLELFLSQPPGCRGTYPAIEMLLPNIGARRLLRNVPDFFPRMLRALLDPTNVSSLVAHLVVTVIQQLRLEQEQEQGQHAVSSSSSAAATAAAAGDDDVVTTAAATAAAASAAAALRNPVRSSASEDWVAHVADALTSPDSLLGKQTATYVLPPLIRQGGIENIDRAQRQRRKATAGSGETVKHGEKKNTRRRKRKMRAILAAGEELPAGDAAEIAFRKKYDVDFAAMLLSNIRARGLAGAATEMDDGSLRACLHVVAAARATVAPALGGSSAGVGSRFVDLFVYMTADEVERALLHADPSVRFRALRLVCVSRQTSRLPSEVEFRLVKRYLPLLMKRYCSFQDANDSLGVADSSGASGEYGGNLVGSSGAAVAAKNSRNNSQSVINGGAGFGRSQTTSLLKHFFARIHDGVESRRRAHVRVLQTQTSFEQKRRRTIAGAGQVDLDMFSRQKQAVVEQSRAELKIVLDRANAFLTWIEAFLLGGVHPGASFERSSTSLELILLMARTWSKKGRNKNKSKSQRKRLEKCEGKSEKQQKQTSTTDASSATTDIAMDEQDRRLLENPTGVGDVASYSVMAGVCRHPAHIGILLNATVVTWDRVRELACQILSDMTGGSADHPDDAVWPGYSTQDSLVPVLRRALGLAASPRRREYEAGAQMLCLLFSKFVVELEWKLPFEQCGAAYPTSSSMSRKDSSSGTSRYAVIAFLDHMCEELCTRLIAQQRRMEQMVQAAIDGVGARGYMDMGGGEKDENEHAHGILMMFRQVLPVIAKTNINGNDEEESALRRICSKLLHAVLQALQSALTVVADEASTEPEPKPEAAERDNCEAASLRKERDSKKEYMARGVVPTTGGGSKPPLRVDCRGHLLLPKKSETTSGGSGAGNDARGDEDALSKHHQTVVVASWLLVKEGSVLLADMVDHLPLERDGSTNGDTSSASSSSRRWLISSSQVRLIGQRLVDSLLGLKHMGAISSAGQAFSIICRRLLQMHPASLREITASQKGYAASASATYTAAHALDVQNLPRVWLGQLLKLVCPTPVLASLSNQYDSHRILVPSATDASSSASNHSTVLFFLRRSTGLATAFVSILRAEPFRGAKATLLQACVAGLVGSLSQGLEINVGKSLVGSDGGSGLKLRKDSSSSSSSSGPSSPSSSLPTLPWQSRVHALNILKMIFEDSVLAPDLRSWSSCVLRIAMLGFCSANWAVRNSSMMLFANLLRHTVGGKVVHSDGSSHNRVTASQFFSRLPLLREFVEREMTRVVSVERVEGGTSTERSLLYPLLMLLSRLRPSLFEEDIDMSSVLGGDRPKLATTATTTLIPLLRRCAVTDRHFSARVMAARAVSNLTPSGVPLAGMLTSARDELYQLANDSASSVTKDHNAAHGVLLLALALVGSLKDRALMVAPAASKTGASSADDEPGKKLDALRLPDGLLSSLCVAAARFGMNVCTNGTECGAVGHKIISVCGHLIDSALQLVAACVSAMEERERAGACLDASMLACLALSLASEHIDMAETAGAGAASEASKEAPLLVMAGSEMRINACCLLGSIALKYRGGESSNHALRGLICFADTHWCPDARQACVREINSLYNFPQVMDLDTIAHEEALQGRLLSLLAKEIHAPSYCAQLALQMRLLKRFHLSTISSTTMMSFDALCASLWGILKAQGILLKNKLCAAPAVVAASLRLVGELLGSPQQQQQERMADDEMYTWFTQVAVVNAKQEEQLSDAQKKSNFATEGNSNVVPSAEVRLAVAEAIHRSKILVRTTKTNVAAQLHAWDTLLGLMQDDDSRVRTESRRAVCASIPSFEGRVIIASRCIRHAYVHLNEIFGATADGSTAFMRYLFDRLEFHSSRIDLLDIDVPALSNSGSMTTMMKKTRKEDLRVFDEDRENFFVEHVLEVELVHLAMMRQSRSGWCFVAWKSLFGSFSPNTLLEFQETMKCRLQKALLAVYWPAYHPRRGPAPQKLYIDECFYRGAYATVLLCHWFVALDSKLAKLWAQLFLEVLADFEKSSGLSGLFGCHDGIQTDESTVESLWMGNMRVSASKSVHPALREAIVFFCKALRAHTSGNKGGWQEETESCLIFGR